MSVAVHEARHEESSIEVDLLHTLPGLEARLRETGLFADPSDLALALQEGAVLNRAELGHLRAAAGACRALKGEQAAPKEARPLRHPRPLEEPYGLGS